MFISLIWYNICRSLLTCFVGLFWHVHTSLLACSYFLFDTILGQAAAFPSASTSRCRSLLTCVYISSSMFILLIWYNHRSGSSDSIFFHLPLYSVVLTYLSVSFNILTGSLLTKRYIPFDKYVSQPAAIRAIETSSTSRDILRVWKILFVSFDIFIGLFWHIHRSLST